MTYEEVLQETYNRLRAQGGPGWDNGKETCSYGGPDTPSCAVGVWLPNEYKAKMLNGPISQCLNYYHTSIFEHLPIPDRQFWMSLQMCHDKWAREPNTEVFFHKFKAEVYDHWHIELQEPT